MAPYRAPLDPRFLDVLTPQGAITYMTARARASDAADSSTLEQLRKEQQFEYEFVKAGGHLMAGVDPHGKWRRHGRFRGPSKSRVARRSRIHSARSCQDRHTKRRQLAPFFRVSS